MKTVLHILLFFLILHVYTNASAEVEPPQSYLLSELYTGESDNVLNFDLVIDEKYVVYDANEVPKPPELPRNVIYRTPVTHSDPVQIGFTLHTDATPGRRLFSKDGRVMVYRAQKAVDEDVQFYAVQVETGVETRLTNQAGIASIPPVTHHRISDDGQWFIFAVASEENNSTIRRIYSVEINTGKLCNIANVVEDEDTVAFLLSVSSDNNLFVYGVRYRVPGTSSFENSYYSVPVTGGEPIPLATRVRNTRSAIVKDIFIYDTDNNADGYREIYSINLTGTNQRLLLDKSSSGYQLEIQSLTSYSFQDKNKYLYVYAKDLRLNSNNLYALSLEDGGLVNLSNSNDTGNQIFYAPWVSKDETWAVFSSGLIGGEVFRVYVASLAGGESNIVAEGSEYTYRLSAHYIDAGRGNVLYVDHSSFDVGELYQTNLQGTETTLLSPQNNMDGFFMSADDPVIVVGEYVTYTVPARSSDPFIRHVNLYRSPLNGGEVFQMTSVEQVFPADDYLVTKNSELTIYRGRQSSRGPFSLYAVRLYDVLFQDQFE